MFVTHNLREAIMLADRIALLSPRRPGCRASWRCRSAGERLDPAAIERVRDEFLARDLPGLRLTG